MKKDRKIQVREWKSKIENFTIHFLFAITFILSLVSTFPGVLSGLFSIRAALPQVIVYASCNLTLIGFILTLVLGLKGGTVHKILMSKSIEVMKSIYRFIFSISFATIATIIISILVISVSPWQSIWLKVVIAALGLWAFYYMLVGTLYLLYFLIELMVKENAI